MAARSLKAKAKARAYNAAWVQENRQERHTRLAIIKLARGCVDCGYREHPEALEFDHVRGIKVGGVTYMAMRFPWRMVLAEIAKCEVRCANCHRVRTAKGRVKSDTERS